MHDGKVTGRLSHIKASSPGGPRYDPAQTDEQRHAFDNLILMCPIHHDVIDADPTAYTVARLGEVKSDHEARHTAGGPNLDDQVAGAFILSDARVEGGSIIVSHNQTGGQIAHEIRNYGPPRRRITQEMRSRVAEVLRGTAPSRIGFASTQGDVEAHEFKEQLMQVFREAGWQVDDMQTFMFFGSKKGLVVTIPFAASQEGLPQVVAHALAQTGSPVAGNHGDMANGCGLYVQVWHAP